MEKLFLFGLMLNLFSCADPNYIDSPSIQNEVSTDSECEFVFNGENLCMKSRWEVFPSTTSFSSLILTFTNASNTENELIDPRLRLEVILWMPSMGHGSSPTTIEHIDKGKFKIKDIFFIMPGDWDIRFQLINGTQVIEEKIQQIAI